MSLEVRNSAIHGKGVFTTEPVSKNSLISRVKIVREITDDCPLNPEKGELLHHCHWYADGTVVLTDKPYCYTNHSCDPNTFLYTIDGVSYVIAMRDIEKDEELTLEYSQCNFGGQVWECKCGSPDCRRLHRCGFRYMDEERQMLLLPYLDPIIVKVHHGYISEMLGKQVRDV